MHMTLPGKCQRNVTDQMGQWEQGDVHQWGTGWANYGTSWCLEKRPGHCWKEANWLHPESTQSDTDADPNGQESRGGLRTFAYCAKASTGTLCLFSPFSKLCEFLTANFKKF